MSTITSPTPAQIAAQRIRNIAFNIPVQLRQQLTTVQSSIANGIAAQGSTAAVDAADLATALGAADLATINGTVTALLAALPAS